MSLGQLAVGCLRKLEDTSWAGGTSPTSNMVFPAFVSIERTLGAPEGMCFLWLGIGCSPGDTL